MKYRILVLVFLLILVSCSKENAYDEMGSDSNLFTRAGNADVNLCHAGVGGNWVFISVNDAAYDMHLAHGDVHLVDNDGDGWVVNENECVPGGDCDDNDATINPGAVEVCDDGIDNNCNGNVDENCCPCFTLNDVLAADNLTYFDTNAGSDACGFQDGIGFTLSACIYGVTYDRFICVSPSCVPTIDITASEKTACQQLIVEAIAILGIPEDCSTRTSNATHQSGIFMSSY